MVGGAPSSLVISSGSSLSPIMRRATADVCISAICLLLGPLENIFKFLVGGGRIIRKRYDHGYHLELHQFPTGTAVLVQFGFAHPFLGGAGAVFPGLGGDT